MIHTILHIGLGKVASSSLQQSFSEKPIQPLINSRAKVRYMSIDNQGNILEGKDLYHQAKNTPNQYKSSVDIHKTFDWDDAIYQNIKLRLESTVKDSNDILLFSNEGWVHQSEYFMKTQFLEKLNLKVKAICYIRNPVELINSAWWQWGAWESTLDVYIDELLSLFESLPRELENWQNIIGKENLSVKLVEKDIVEDFYSSYNIPKDSKEYKNNQSLKSEFLRFYQKHPELRSSKDNSQLDFILSNLFSKDHGFTETPWVLEAKHIQYILEKSKKINNLLIPFLDYKSKKTLLEDSKWWDISAFKDKKVQSTEYNSSNLSCEQLDYMLLKSIEKLKNIYIENLGLKYKLDIQ